MFLFTTLYLERYGVIVANSDSPFRRVSAIYGRCEYCGLIYLTDFILMTYHWFYPCLNLLRTQKIRNKTVEVPFVIPGMSTKRQRDLRFKPIVKSNIGFLLEFDWYLSDKVDPVQDPVYISVFTSPCTINLQH